MAKRLRVILQDPEYREIQHMALAPHVNRRVGPASAGPGASPGAFGRCRQETRSHPRGGAARLSRGRYRHYAGRDRKRIRNRPAALILIDSNIPMYLIGAPHPHKSDAQRLLEKLVSDRQRLVTDAEVPT